MVRARPKTRRAKLIRKRRCGKCGSVLNTQVKRCKRCGNAQGFSVPGKHTPKAHYRAGKSRASQIAWQLGK
jgi:rRNA maturation protein Nop10